MVAHTPGPMANGNWTVAAYIDERADDKQTEALGAIFTGAAGGPMAAFVPLISNISERRRRRSNIRSTVRSARRKFLIS